MLLSALGLTILYFSNCITQVKNMHLKEVAVPAVICLIPGPDSAAVSASLKYASFS